MFRQHFRKEDVFRIGGDEFVALCRDIPEDRFSAKTEGFQREVERLYPGALAVGTVWDSGDVRVMDMVKQADALMYEHKRKCRACKRRID